MALTLRTQAQSASGTSNPTTVAVTTQTGDALLVVAILSATTGARTGGNPTWNGVELTQAGTAQAGSAECNTELWYKLAPAVGSYNVSVPNSGSKAMRVDVAVFAGNTARLFTKVLQTGTSSASPSLTIDTLPAGSVCVAACGSGWRDPSTSHVGTAIYENDEGVYIDCFSYVALAAAGSGTIGWTFGGSDDVAMVMAAFTDNGSEASSTIGLGTDDATNESAAWPGQGTLKTTDAYASVGNESGSNWRMAGYRFQNLTVPKGATIVNAVLTIRAGSDDTNGVYWVIAGEKVANPATWGTGHEPYSQGYVNRTTATVNWTLDGTGNTAWKLGRHYNSPDIKTVIQELIDQASWASGNAMALVVWQTQATSSFRYAEFYEDTPTGTWAATLTIAYTGPDALQTITCVMG